MGTVKPRKRYLLFHVEAEKQLHEKNVKEAVFSGFQRLFGEVEAGRLGIRWVGFKPEERWGILLCSQEAVVKVRAALALLTSLEGGKARFSTVRVSGTLKSLREFLRERKP
ncbi:hypothetical protein DRO53_00595 [Candidatus Bathyarchaeota archaeon]|nr:MAG: hypothetical protein DRO46_03485 [Candidatus Hecatellales archaeon]RLI35684.1 MAG: hypothetical protein DRO53_00595 [Candidatus Bathyarchaeota archaeon]